MEIMNETNLLEIKLLAARMTRAQRKETITSCDSAMINLLGQIRPLKKEVEELEKAFTYQAELKDACQRKVVPIQLIPTVTKKKRKITKNPKPNRKLTEVEKIRNDLVIKQKLMKRILEKRYDRSNDK